MMFITTLARLPIGQCRAVVFDCFGTLLQPGSRHRPYGQLMSYLRAQGRQPQPDDAQVLMSQPLALSEVLPHFGYTNDMALLAQCEKALYSDLAAIRVYPDAVPALDFLHQKGIRTAFCSNLALPYHVAVKTLLPPVDHYVLSYEAGLIKPQPEIYRRCVDVLKVPANEVLFVGDHPVLDYEAPLRFGMQAVLLKRASQS